MATSLAGCGPALRIRPTFLGGPLVSPGLEALTSPQPQRRVLPVAASLRRGQAGRWHGIEAPQLAAPAFPTRSTSLPPRGPLVCGVTVVGRSEDVPAAEDGEECEVVQGQEVVLGEGPPGVPTTPIKADDKTRFAGYMVIPLKNSNGSGVLLLPDVLGYASKENREFAHRLACFGYTILVPDLFRGHPWDNSVPDNEYEAWRAMHANPARRVAEDIHTASLYLRTYILQSQEPEGAVPKMAVMGFCFGGGRVLEALARDGVEEEPMFATGVSFYGTRFDAAAVAESIKVPVLMIVGEQDPKSPVSSFTTVGDRVEGAEVLVYPDRGHAFVHRPATMDEDDDAENAFQVARHWLHKHLLIDSNFN